MALLSLFSVQREILLDPAHLWGARLCLLSSTSFGLASLAQHSLLVQSTVPGTSHMIWLPTLVLGAVDRETSLGRWDMSGGLRAELIITVRQVTKAQWLVPASHSSFLHFPRLKSNGPWALLNVAFLQALPAVFFLIKYISGLNTGEQDSGLVNPRAQERSVYSQQVPEYLGPQRKSKSSLSTQLQLWFTDLLSLIII